MRYFIGFLISIGLIILLIILLVSGGGKPKVPNTSKTLTSYATTNAEVSMTIDGPINAEVLHQQIRVTVDRDNVTYEQLKGYEGNVTTMKRFPNTESAYDVFLHALARAGFTQGNTTDKALQDEKGYCPLGSRYIFKLTQNGRDLERLWASSCGKPKSYLGATETTLSLFKAQVPEYDTLSQNISL